MNNYTPPHTHPHTPKKNKQKTTIKSISTDTSTFIVYDSRYFQFQVRVQILDENDNKPIFDRHTFYFEIREDSSSDTTVNPTDAKVIATDADIDANAEIKYKILESGGE